MTNTKNTKQTCSVCLRPFVARNGSPVRHGFQIHNLRRGQTGNAWQTGRCEGSRFAVYELSCEGTRWALGEIEKSIAHAEAALLRLEEGGPVRFEHNGVRPGPAPRTLLPGSEGYRDDRYWIPSHATHQEQLTRLAQRRLDSLNAARAEYRTHIENWKPAE